MTDHSPASTSQPGSNGQVQEHCRECRDEAEWLAPAVPAEFILWGKMFPPEALGPRCYRHAEKWIGRGMQEIEQWAVFDLRPLARLHEAEQRAARLAGEAEHWAQRCAETVDEREAADARAERAEAERDEAREHHRRRVKDGADTYATWGLMASASLLRTTRPSQGCASGAEAAPAAVAKSAPCSPLAGVPLRGRPMPSPPKVDSLVSLRQSRKQLLRWAREDPRSPDAAPAKAREGLRQKFVREADPDGSLDPAERDRRAECLRRAFYKGLAAKSVAARRARAAARTRRESTDVDGAA